MDLKTVKAKTLIFKDSREFAHVLLDYSPDLFSSQLPHLYGETTTLECITEYYEKHAKFKHDFSNVELIDIEIKAFI